MRKSSLKTLIALAILTACSSDSLGPASQPTLASLDVSLAASTLSIGQTTQAFATLKDSAGRSMTVTGDTVKWTSSNTAVATIAPSTGIVTAVSAGTATIFGSTNGRTGGATLTVSAASTSAVGAITLSIASPTLGFGQSTQATAVVTDANGNVVTDRVVTWASSNSSIATVSQGGIVTGLGPGTATITATSGTVSGSASVTVGSVPVNSIAVALSAPTITINGTAQATAVVKDVAGNVLTDRAVTWSSTNPAVATVSSTGAVTGVAQGAANITATVDGQTGGATLSVAVVPVQTVNLVVKGTLFVGEHAIAIATLYDSTGTPIAGRPIGWSSSNPGVASVADDGVVTGLAPGTATISATSEGKTGSATLTISAPGTLVPTSIIVTLSAGAMNVSGTGQATASIRDQAGNPIAGQAVTWSSSNPSVATINASTGAYTAVGAGTTTIRATAGAVSGGASLAVGSVSSQLAFVTQPAGAVSGLNLSTQPVVEVVDAANALVTGSTVSVTASIGSGSGTLSGTTTVNAVNGVATFTNLKISGSGAHTLVFSATGLPAVTSSPIAVVQVPAALTIQTQPSGATSAAPLATQPKVRVLDNAGLQISTSSLSVTAGISSGSGTLSGTTTVNAVNGVASFTNLAVNGSGNFALTFSASGTTSAVSAPFTIATSTGGGTPTVGSLVVTSQPAGALSGVAFSTQPVVELHDGSNNLAAGSSATVTASIASGAGTLGGTTTVAAVNGVASFTNLSISGAGSYTLSFSANNSTSASSSSFAVTQRAAALSIQRQPSGGTAGAALGTQPIVRIVDDAGLLHASANIPVTAAIVSGSGALTGTTTVTSVNGVATFTNLQISAGGSFVLGFSTASPSLSTASTAFTVSAPTAPAAAKLAITTQPAGATSGSVFATQPVVEVRDASGNLVNSSAPVTAVLSSGAGTLSGTTTVNAVNGVATFSNLSIVGNGQQMLTFGSPGLTSVTTSPFVLAVPQAPPTQLAVATQPGAAMSGAMLSPQPVVQVRDANSAVVSTATTSVTASIASGTGTLSGTTTVSAVNGVATFTNLKVTGSGMQTLAFAATGLAPATSSGFMISQPATASALAIQVQPSGGATGAAFGTQPVVRIVDNTGAVVSSTLSVTASIASGTGTLGGTTTVAAVNGVATFSNLSITGSGSYTLKFAATGLTAATSNAFNVTAAVAPATAASLAMQTQPVGALSGAALATQPVVRILDASGALITSGSSSTLPVTVAIWSGGGTLSGTTTVNAVGGVATFSGLSISGSGTFVLLFSTTTPALQVGSSPLTITVPGGGVSAPSGVLATSNFSSGTASPFTFTAPNNTSIIDDPTSSGKGKVVQLTYSGTGSKLDLNRAIQYNPPASMSLGSTFFFGGDFYFPANTVNFTNGAAQRKLLYFRTIKGDSGANNQIDMFCVVHMWGNALQVEWSDWTTSGGGDKVSSMLSTVAAGTWNHLETQVTMNSSLSATDGIIRVWLNGTLVFENTSVRFTQPGWTTAPFWHDWWVGMQREGTDTGGSGAVESSINEVRYWDNVTFSTSRVP